MTISGSGFTGATAVMFGATAAPQFTVVSDGRLTTTSPSGQIHSRTETIAAARAEALFVRDVPGTTQPARTDITEAIRVAVRPCIAQTHARCAPHAAHAPCIAQTHARCPQHARSRPAPRSRSYLCGGGPEARLLG